MREPRNPFRLRSAEDIESDATFLRLFGPGILELLVPDDLWEKPKIFRSAPGGGKTSLLRLFTPNVLHTLHAYRTTEECRELYQKMCDLQVLRDQGPVLLGVILSAARNYASLTDLEGDSHRKRRLLFALLNSRIIIAFLRGALALKGAIFPNDLARLTILSPSTQIPTPMPQLPCRGTEAYDWAREVEASVCKSLDSFGPDELPSVAGHDSLFSLSLLTRESFLFDQEPIAERFLFMFDDVHLLTFYQRELLLNTIVETRRGMTAWVSERFEALSPDELLTSGAILGRDYGGVVSLEDYWRERPKRFESVVLNIADRRARAAADIEIGAFEPCLETSLDGTEWQEQFQSALEAIKLRVLSLAENHTQFTEWVTVREAIQGTPREKAVAWRTLEILIQREKRKSQTSFDFPLSSEDLEDKDDSAVNAAAELFLAEEFRLPYYFGFSKLASLASSNIEQFLWLAGENFEEVASNALLGRAPRLSPDRQDSIIRRAVKRAWDEIPRRVRKGRDVRYFLEAIGLLAKQETYRPSAPYAAGVTGIAISMADRNRILEAKNAPGIDLSTLREVLASALANNLLEPILDYKCKGERWMVLNLNRFLCVHFGLPLQRGGWREQSLLTLCDWLAHGFKPNKKDSVLIS